MEKVVEGYVMPEQSLGQKVDRLTEIMEQGGGPSEKKSKSFRMPLKGKIGKAKLNQGYVTVLEIAENDVASFTREIIKDGTIKLRETYHAVDDQDILSYKSKPLIILPKKSKTPYNPNRIDNNTFAQKHIMSRMMNETLGEKKGIGGLGMSIGAIVLLGALAYAFIAG